MKKENKKKKYEKPTVDTRDIYEVNALGCSKCANSTTISLSASCIRGLKKFS